MLLAVQGNQSPHLLGIGISYFKGISVCFSTHLCGYQYFYIKDGFSLRMKIRLNYLEIVCKPLEGLIATSEPFLNISSRYFNGHTTTQQDR